MVKKETIIKNYREQFYVNSLNSDNFYCVELSCRPVCSCIDFLKHNSMDKKQCNQRPLRIPCKHIIFVFLKILGVDQEKNCFWYQQKLYPHEINQCLVEGNKKWINLDQRLCCTEEKYQLFLKVAAEWKKLGANGQYNTLVHQYNKRFN